MTEGRVLTTISCHVCGYMGPWGSCYCDDNTVEKRLASSDEVIADLTRRVERLERAVWPSAHDHEWASTEEAANIPRCTCVQWTCYVTDKPRRSPNAYCKFPH